MSRMNPKLWGTGRRVSRISKIRYRRRVKGERLQTTDDDAMIQVRGESDRERVCGAHRLRVEGMRVGGRMQKTVQS